MQKSAMKYYTKMICKFWIMLFVECELNTTYVGYLSNRPNFLWIVSGQMFIQVRNEQYTKTESYFEYILEATKCTIRNV